VVFMSQYSEEWLLSHRQKLIGYKSVAKINKFKATKKEVNGIKFDSKGEAERYQYLLMLQSAGEIKGLTLQPSFILAESFRHKGILHRAIGYRADFNYFDVTLDTKVVEDFKGVETPLFKLKKKLLISKFLGEFVFRASKTKGKGYLILDF